jgi:hypothetical protein
MSTLATPANMKRFEHVAGMMAYSPTTYEEYSATPDDHWNLPNTQALTDYYGEDMILVVRRSYLTDVDDVAAEV